MYWVELHCDTPLDEAPKTVWQDVSPYKKLNCSNINGDNPGVKTSRLNAGKIQKEARLQGYRYKRGVGWQCPHCLRYRNTK